MTTTTPDQRSWPSQTTLQKKRCSPWSARGSNDGNYDATAGQTVAVVVAVLVAPGEATAVVVVDGVPAVEAAKGDATDRTAVVDAAQVDAAAPAAAVDRVESAVAAVVSARAATQVTPMMAWRTQPQFVHGKS